MGDFIIELRTETNLNIQFEEMPAFKIADREYYCIEFMRNRDNEYCYRLEEKEHFLDRINPKISYSFKSSKQN